MIKRIPATLKRFTYCPFKPLNNSGFTLVETLVAIFVTSLTVLLITFLIQYFQSIYHHLEKDEFYEWHVFLHQYEHEVADLVFDYAEDQHLIFRTQATETSKPHDINFSRYSTMIRRQVDWQGHQPMLMHVNFVEFKENDIDVTLNVRFESGEKYRAYLPAQKKAEEETDEE